MSEQAGGNNRRLNDAEQARGAEMFAAGKSEREVADALGCSASTAHRLRERLQSAAEGAAEAETDEEAPGLVPGSVIHMRLLPGDRVEIVDPAAGLGDEVEDAMRTGALAQLVQARDEAAGALSDLEDRAGTLRQAIAADEAEWAEGARTGRDPQELRELRQRIRDAADDLAAKELAIGTGRQRLAVAGARIAEAEAEIAAAEAEKACQEAAKLAARLAPQAARALRDAVTGDAPVRALADLAAQLAQAEQVSGRSHDAEVLPPAMPGHPMDNWHRAVYGLWQAARTGNVAACQAAVPQCVPWQDRDPEEIARTAEEVMQRQVAMDQMIRDNQARLWAKRTSPGSPLELPNPTPGSVQTARTGW